MPDKRSRAERVEFRTTADVRALLDRALAECGDSMTEFAERHLVSAAQQVLADRTRFDLSAPAAAEWEAVNSRPARELPGLKRLMERPSPFTP